MSKKLYILDRSCVSLINKRILNGQIIDQKKASFVRKLKFLDRPENFISLVLSCYEGASGKRIEDVSEYIKMLNTECKSVEKFYKLANTDRQILLSKKEDFFGIHLKNEWEINFDRYESFINNSVSLIANKQSVKNAHKVKYKIFELAKLNNIKPNHPIPFLFLSALYGCEDARNVIKPNIIYKKTYNCLSDILGINRFAYWKYISMPEGDTGNPTFSHVEYVTADKSLNAVYGLLNIDCISSANQDDGQTVTTFRCNPKPGLFPNLSEDEFHELIHSLTSMASQY